MHSVQRKESYRSSAEQRLSSFANETWRSPPIAQYDDSYQGERIIEAATGGWTGDETGSDRIETDMEKGIWKRISLEVVGEPSRQG